MLGYYKNPQATAAAIDAEGWLHTGDLAVRLPNGYYKITGRIKDMVIRGGENIYPREIEEFLFTHPAVEQAAVVGVPDDRWGERPVALVMAKAGAAVPTEESIRRHVTQFAEQGVISKYGVPDRVYFVDAIPKTSVGKLDKKVIRAKLPDLDATRPGASSH